jgi:uncharacterized damage-inducible protein DinB
MKAGQPKIGRPRQYDFTPAEGIANPAAAMAVAGLDELSARVFDLIEDLPASALTRRAGEGLGSIATLVLHMAGGEARWISRACGQELPAELAEKLDCDRDGPAPSVDAAGLIAICREVREDVTRRRLAKVGDIDAEVTAGEQVISLRGVLMHQLWHWCYHMGQVGLLRFLSGSNYHWQMDRRLTGHGG